MFGKMTRPCLCQAFSKFVPRVKRGNPKNIKPSVSFIKCSLFGLVKRGEFGASAREYQAQTRAGEATVWEACSVEA